MKLIRWLFSNIILIVFVLAITYAYVYWDNLAGEDTPLGKAVAYLSVEYDEVREFLDSYDFGDGQADLITEPEPVAEMTETAPVPQVVSPARPLPPQSLQQPQATAQTMTQQPPVQASRPPMPAAPAASQPPLVAASQGQRPSLAMQPQPPATQPAQPMPARPGSAQAPAPAEKSEAEIRQLWISAREDYHRGNIEQSIANYQQVIAALGENYDAYGELGNVYLSRGRYREAADAYYQAAAILVKQGQRHRARSLLPMLERLDRARAEELNQLLYAPRS